MYLVCLENGGCIEEGMLFQSHSDAVAELRRRQARDLSLKTSVAPADGFWIEEDVCYANPCGNGYVSITSIPEEAIHGGSCGAYYAVNMDNGGSVTNVELFDNAYDGYHALLGLVQSWNDACGKEDPYMKMVEGDENRYDDGCGFGYVFNNSVMEVF